MTQETFERATMLALITFTAAVGCFALVGVLLTLLQLAADTAAAIGAAGVGAGISLAVRKGGKS